MSSTIFTKRPVFALLSEVGVPSGCQASGSDADTGRLQNMARPIPPPAAAAVTSMSQASSCMPAAPSLFVVTGRMVKRRGKGLPAPEPNKSEKRFGEIKKCKTSQNILQGEGRGAVGPGEKIENKTTYSNEIGKRMSITSSSPPKQLTTRQDARENLDR